MILDQILSHVRKRVHLSLHHLIDEDALFDDLRLNTVDAWGIAADIEEELDRELDWDAAEKWSSISDIIASVRTMTGVPA